MDKQMPEKIRKTVQVRVEEAVHRALRIQALQEGKTLSCVLVEALEAHVQARREVRP